MIIYESIQLMTMIEHWYGALGGEYIWGYVWMLPADPTRIWEHLWKSKKTNLLKKKKNLDAHCIHIVFFPSLVAGPACLLGPVTTPTCLFILDFWPYSFLRVLMSSNLHFYLPGDSYNPQQQWFWRLSGYNWHAGNLVVHIDTAWCIGGW